MVAYSRDEAAGWAGVEPGYVDRLVELGVLVPDGDRFSDGDVRRAMMTRSVEEAGISVEGMAAALRGRALSLDFLDAPAYERFATFAAETFREVSERTGVPLELLTIAREATGLAAPSPDDRMRRDEMEIVPFLELQVRLGFRTASIERLMRVQGDATRRITESEGAWWVSEVIAPAIASGKGVDAMADAALASQTSPLAEQAMLAMYHAQQARAWTANLIESFETLLANAGLHSRLDRPPAVCFLDITGYTRGSPRSAATMPRRTSRRRSPTSSSAAPFRTAASRSSGSVTGSCSSSEIRDRPRRPRSRWSRGWMRQASRRRTSAFMRARCSSSRATTSGRR